ncbi:MAG: hypothetical protein ACFE95_08100, partial [Candidatus Hodarchaeota archaeon]
MWTKKHKYLLNGVLLFLLFSMLTSITAIRADNTLYPLNNYFAFGENGTITKGVSNESYTIENSFRVHEILSEQDAYKFRVIFSVPDKPFEILSLRVRMIFTEKITEVIRWGYARNVSVSVYPFELATIDGMNNSAQVLDALDLYHGKEVQFHFNTTAFEELEFFELAFSSWNATPNLRGVQFEQINFHMPPENIFSETAFLVMLGSAGLFGVSIACPTRFRSVLLILLAIMLLLVPLTVVIQVRNILDSLPQEDKGVTRFTFFGRVYERRDLGNGYFSLRMVKDLTKAFELQALSGTGETVVYPMIENETEQNEAFLLSNPIQGEGSSNNDLIQQPTSGNGERKLIPNFSFGDISGNPTWWNSSYKYVRQITSTADTALTTNYTIQLDLDTATLVSNSKMRADAKDLRVTYYNTSDSTWYELDRVVLNNNTVKTSVFFRLQKDIAASSSDSNYALYYGIISGDPGNPPSDPTKIFIDYDDFSSGDLSGYSPTNGWTVNTDSTKPTNIGWWSTDDYALSPVTADAALNRSNVLTTNNQILVLAKTSNSGTNSSIRLRSDINGPDYLILEHTSTDLILRRYNGTNTVFNTTSGGFSTTNWYFYKFQVVGNTLKGKYWLSENTEPSGWNLTNTTTGLSTSGHLVFAANNSGMRLGMWGLMAAVANPPSVSYDVEEAFPEITDVKIVDPDANVVHSQNKNYTFRVEITDYSGDTDIDYVQLNFTANSFEYSVGYNRTANTFIEISDNIANHIILDTDGSSAIGAGTYLEVNFKIKTDWDFPDASNIPLEAYVNDSLSHSDNENSLTNYDFNNEIEVSSFNVNDHYINPNYLSDLTFTGNVYYKTTTIPVPAAQISSVSIYRDDSPDVNVTTSIDTVSAFTVSADSETTVGNYTYYPVVVLAGDGGSPDLSTTTTEVDVDRVLITNIEISAFSYNDGSRYWEDNDASGDAFTITITAEWDYTGNTYIGEVQVGYTGNPAIYGTTTNLVRNDVEENPTLGNIIERDDITVGSAVIGPNNVYGTEVILDGTLASNLPDIGWDNDPPNIDHDPSATNESSNYLYYDGTSNYGYYSDNMGVTGDTFNIGGTASDIGSGLQGVTDNTDFGGNPSRSGLLSTWSFGYSIDQDNSTYGTITVTYTATDRVGNTKSTTFQFRVDNTNPTLGSLNLLLTADSDSVGNGITPDTGYYDDDSVDISITGTPSDSGGSGLPTDVYSYRADDGSYNSSWHSGGGAIVSMNEGSRTIFVRVRDRVGNIATDIDSVNVVVDTISPSGYTSTIHEINNFQYIYAPDGTSVYFNGAYDDIQFDVEINDVGVEDNFWKVRFPPAFGESLEEDDTLPYRRITDYDIDSTDSETTIEVWVIDRAGNHLPISIDVTEDSTAPTVSTLSLLLTADTDSVGNGINPDTGYYDDNSVNVTTSGSPADSGSDLPTNRYSYKYDGGTYGSWISTGTTLNSVPEGVRTIYVRVRDNVGNIANELASVGVVVDLTNPTGYTSTIYETNNDQYLYEDGSGTLIYFNGAYDNLGFDVEISVGIESNFWNVTFPDAFNDGQEEDDTAPYRRSIDYDIDSTDSETTINVLVIDRAGRTQTITITVTEDSTAPILNTLDLLLTADTDSVGNGIDPDTGYYDDNSVDVTITGSPTDSGSGVPTVRFSYKYDGGTYGSWFSGGTTLTSVPEGSRTIYVQVRDNVGNNATELDSVPVVVDLNPPSGYTSKIYETNNGQYLYNETGTLIYFNGAYDDLGFDIRVSGGSDTNFWKVRFPAAFGESQEEDTSAPYERTIDYNIDSTDSETTIEVWVIDRAGNHLPISIDVTEDSIAPTISTLSLLLTTDTDSVGNGIDPDTGYYDDNSVDVTPTGSPADSESGVPTDKYSYKYGGGSYGSWLSGGTTLTSVPEGSQTIYVRVRDNVGNIANELTSVGVVVDLTDPTGFTSNIYETNNAQYLFEDGSGTLIYFNGAYDNLGFDVEISVGTEINFWNVTFPDAFNDGQEEDDTAPYRRSIDYDIDSTDSETTINVLVIDRAGRTQTITITVTEDSTAPILNTLDLLLTADTDSVGNGIDPDTGYYDDDSVDVTITGSPTDGGSGVPTVRYSYKYDGGTYGSWLSGGTTLTSVPEGSQTIYVRVRDNVGNIAPDLDSIPVVVDLTPPLSYTSKIYETNNGQYLYNETGTLIYFNGAYDNLGFDVRITAGTEINFWKVRFPAAFGESQEEDTSAPYERSTDYDIDSTDVGTSFDILIIDSAGRTQTITITVTEDSTAPTIGTLNLYLLADSDSVGNSIDPDTGYFDDNSVDVNITGIPTDGGSGIPINAFSYRYGGGSYGAWVSDVGEVTLVPEGSQTIYVRVRDNVENIGTDIDSIGVIVDLTNPTGYTTTLTETNNVQYLHIDSGTLIYFNGSLDDLWFDIRANVGTEVNFWKVRFPAAFGESQEEDTSAPYERSTDYDIDATDLETTIDVLVIDRAGRSQTISVDVTEDSTAPTLDTITPYMDTTDSNLDGYDPYGFAYGYTEAFYDQSDFIANLTFTETASGIYSVQIRSDTGTYGSSVISGIDVPCTLTADANNTIWYRFEDNVGNVRELASDINVYYGVTAPTSFDVDINGALAWTPSTPNFVFIADPTDITSGTIYLNTGQSDTWTISVDADGAADWQDGNLGWFVVFEAGWGAIEDTDTVPGPYQSNSYSTQGTSEADLWIDIVNRCGIRKRITLTTTSDTTGPSMDSITVRGNDSAPLEDWDQDGRGFTITPSTITDGGSGNNGYYVEVDPVGDPDINHNYEYVFPGFTYPGDVGAGPSYTFSAQPVDKVGNLGPVRSDVGYVDETPPSTISAQFTNEGVSPNWFDQGSVSTANYQITFSETNVYSISVTVTGGLSATGAGQGQSSPFDSSISISGKSDGTYDISITITDKAGHIETTFTGEDQIKLDNTAPSATFYHLTNYVKETSDYLYWDSGSSILWYGDDMGGAAQSFKIGINASDGGVNLDYAIASNNSDFSFFSNSTEGTNPTYFVVVGDIIDLDTNTSDIIINVYDLLGNCNNSLTLSIDRDTAGPSGYSLTLLPDTTADIGYLPNTGYYDDGSVYVDATDIGSITETGSGIPVDCYSFQRGALGWSPWDSSDTNTFTSVPTGVHTLYVKVRDNVGNEENDQSTSVTVDTTSPTNDFTLTWDRAGGYPDYADFNGTAINFNSERNDYFNVTVNNDGTNIGTSGFWKIEWDKEGLFESPENDTTGIPDSKNFNYYQDTDGFFIIRLINNAGNYYEWNYPAVAQVVVVVVTVTSVSISESSPYLYYDGSSKFGYYSDNMGASAVEFIVGGTASTGLGFISSVTQNGTTFGGDPTNTGTNASWSFSYWID